MPRESTRKHKVAAEVQRLLNELLLTEIKDPRLTGATVSEVDVSGDLGIATVFFNTLTLEDDAADAKAGFEQARGFLRSRVGQTLQLRRVPELRFRHDTTARRALAMDRLISESNAGKPPK